ncbi:GCN5-related N-acetyltransferase [Stackebrandtia nassauensis DSM 44728]|uniref:GCN5-related N-acetyltransferase n=2 Tax=Stackebrandtia TaxID=283810 RepID=D3QAX6_STANL|nr:GCN5-related N-acetyltransferase [Stackebrandtia nassauensis DSM 44728]
MTISKLLKCYPMRYVEYDPSPKDKQSTAEISIRVAESEADFEACAVLSNRYIREADLESSREDTQRHAAGRGNSVLIACLPDGEIVGYARVTWVGVPPKAPDNVAPPGFYLGGMAVAAEYRRRGVGRQLTVHRMKLLSRLADEAWYIVNSSNEASIDLHLEHGFHEATREFVFPGDVSDGPGTILCHAPLGPTASRCPGCPPA